MKNIKTLLGLVAFYLLHLAPTVAQNQNPASVKYVINRLDGSQVITRNNLNQFITIENLNLKQWVFYVENPNKKIKLNKIELIVLPDVFKVDFKWADKEIQCSSNADIRKVKDTLVIKFYYTDTATKKDGVNEIKMAISKKQTEVQITPDQKEAVLICKKPASDNNYGEVAENFEDNQKVLVYDFNPNLAIRGLYLVSKQGDGLITKKVSPSALRFKSKDIVYMKVYNTNRFMYDVTVNRNLTNFTSEPSLLFRRLFLGDSQTITGIIGALSPKDQVVKNSSGGEINLADSLMAFYEIWNKTRAEVLKIYNPCADFDCCAANPTESYLNLLNSLRRLKLILATANSRYRLLRIDSISQENIIAQCNQTNANLKTNTERLNAELLKLKKDLENNKDTAQINKINKRLKLIADTLGILAKNKCDKTEEAQRKLNEIKAAMLNYYYYLRLDYQLPSDAEIRREMVLIMNEVAQNNGYLAGPILLNGNAVDINLYIKLKSYMHDTLGIPNYNDSVKMHYTIYQPLTGSFSTGSFVALSNKKLQNKTYSFQQIPDSKGIISDSSNKILSESGLTPLPMGLCAYGNLQFMASPSIGLGFNVGVGTTLEKSPRMAYLGGASVFLGSERQLQISSGIMGINVQTINQEWKSASEQNLLFSKTAQNSSLTYFNKFQTGFYISVAYTPFKISKKRI